MQFIEEYKSIRPASERIDSLDFCDADACPSCDLEEGEPACLRRKADFCLRLAVRNLSADLRAGLAKLSLDLLRDSDALEKERVVLGNKLERD
jgi:hypothetical protein